MGEIIHVALGGSFENGQRLCLLFYAAEVAQPEVITLSEEHTEYNWAVNADGLEMFDADRAALEVYKNFKTQ